MSAPIVPQTPHNFKTERSDPNAQALAVADNLRPAIDQLAARRTMAAHLWRGGAFGCYWRKAGKVSTWVEAGRQVTPPGGGDVYFGVHPVTAIPPTNAAGERKPPAEVRSQAAYIAAVNCLFAEFDAKDFDGGKPAILAHLEDLWKSEDAIPYPSVIVDSGGGYHCYWLLEHTVTVTDENRAQLDALQKAWVDLVGSDGGAKDLARVLRVPGTVNRKPEYGPHFPTVTFHEANFRRVYDLALFEALTAHHSYEPTPEPAQSAPAHRTGYTMLDNLEGAARNLRRLATWRVDDYKAWIDVGMALSELGGAGLQLWEEFSARSCKYQPGECAAKWKTFKPGGGLTLASLRHWADADSGAPTPAPVYTNGHTPPAVNGAHHVDESAKPGTPAEAQDAGPEQLTDTGNARRFARQHGHNLRYVATYGKWLVWDGQRWTLDETGQVMRWAKETAMSFYADAARFNELAAAALAKAQAAALEDDPAIGETANAELKRLQKLAASHAKHALICQGRARLEAMVKLAESEPPIPARAGDFDQAPWLLNCTNGTLDLRTFKLHAHRRGDMLTQLCPTPYEPGAQCPTWLAHLERIFDGDAELTSYFHRYAGYCLTGDVSEQTLLIPHGSGANGKSVTVRAVLDVMGPDYAGQAAPDLLVMSRDRHPTELADLRGKRLIASIEVDDGRRMAEGLVKQLTGGDFVKARRMREDFFQFEPTAKLFLVTNHKPEVRGTDHAIWRRIRLLPFEVTIPAKERDKKLQAKLQAEAAGILAWLVRGCLAWQREGLEPPQKVMAATQEYQAENDTIGAFLEECTAKHEGARVKANTLFQAYEAWCDQWGEKARLNGKRFGQAIAERGFVKERDMYGFHYVGLGLLQAEGETTNGA